MTTDPRYVAPVAPQQPVAGMQDVLGQLDKIIRRFEHRHEGQWHTEVFEDVLFSGSELLGAVIFPARNCGFKARSIIAYNSSAHDLALTGGIIIPAILTFSAVGAAASLVVLTATSAPAAVVAAPAHVLVHGGAEPDVYYDG